MEADLHTIFCISSAGWHECNDKYKISRPYGSNEYLLLFTIKGKGNLNFNGNIIELTPNTLAVIPPDIPNSYYTPTGGLWEFYWIHPAGQNSNNICERLYNSILKRFYKVLCEVSDTELIFSQLNNIIKLDNASGDINLQASQIFLNIIHRVLLQVERTKDGKNDYIDFATSYFESNFNKKIDINELCKKVHLTKSHFIRVFKKETGITPYESLLKVRISKATQLVKYTDKPIKEISVLVGFNQPSNFIGQFKRIIGVTPLEYREQRLLGPGKPAGGEDFK